MQNFFTKQLFLIGAILLLSKISTAQTEYLATVNPLTGTINKIDSIPGVTWLSAFETPTYCESNQRYTFIGGDDPGGNPFYLFTVDAVTGDIIYNPIFINHKNFLCLQYAKSSNQLYGIVRDPAANLNSIASIDPSSATYNILVDLTGLSATLKLFVDESHNRFYVFGQDNIGRTLWTIDMTTGTVIGQAHFTDPILFPVLNYSNNTFYALYPTNSPSPGFWTLCSINPSSGIKTNIGVVQNLFTVTVWGNETLDENNGKYIVSGIQSGFPGIRLMSIDITMGSMTSAVTIPQDGTLPGENLIAFRYDNTHPKLYALFWEGVTAGPVPVSLTNFNAIQENGSVVCSWKTEQEINCNRFEIERSYNGTDFTKAGTVLAAGNSSVSKDYRFTDIISSFENSYVYYRLKIIDNDGHYNYSQVEKLKLKTSSLLSIQPNPVSDYISANMVSSVSCKAVMTIVDLSGKELYRKSISLTKGRNLLNITSAFLPAGEYILSIKGEENYSAGFIKR